MAQSHQRFFTALANGAGLAELTALDVLFLDPQGEWFEGGHAEKRIRSLSSPRLSLGDSRQRVLGGFGLVHGLLETGIGDTPLMRYTAAYQERDLGWRLVHLQYTPLAPGVALEVRQGTAPGSTPWSGKDPSGADGEVLRQLNSNYVGAFREADVAWYEAHLAPDYVVVNSNGSMDDRAQALFEFAKPVYRDHIHSFPVDKVRIRQFGSAALIDAENAFELKDGRHGVNRYTDIWYKQQTGRWFCLAAHITANKAPV